MGEITSGVNWLAVAVSTLLAYLLGWLWYSPKLFGPKWMEGARVTLVDGAPMPIAPMVVQLIGTFLLAWVAGIAAAHQALLTLILISLTISVLIIAGGLYSQKSHYAILVEAGYVMAMVLVMIICQGLL